MNFRIFVLLGFIFLAVFSGFRCGALVRDCLQNSDCPASSKCNAHRCVIPPIPKCRTTQDCQPNQTCKQNKCQRAIPSCQTDKDCTQNLICKRNKCIHRDACKKDDDCKVKERCDKNICQPLPTCFTNENCAPSESCQLGYCKDKPPCVPTKESCDNKDNNCDGKIDEDLTRTCYTGTTKSRHKGICKDGLEICSNGQWGSCKGETKPIQEQCNDQVDNNCDGQINEDCKIGPQALGEWCNPTSKFCQKGLVCHGNICHARCDKEKGMSDNPSCSTTYKELCSQTNVGYVCKQQCNRNNTECPPYKYCEITKIGVCVPNYPPQEGTQVLDQTCKRVSSQTDEQCYSEKGFACISGRCKQACVPSKKACPTGERCITSRESFLGGYCSR